MFQNLIKIKNDRIKKIKFFVKSYNEAFDKKTNNIIHNVISNKLESSVCFSLAKATGLCRANQMMIHHIEPVYSDQTLYDIAKEIMCDNFPEESMDKMHFINQVVWIKSQLQFYPILKKNINLANKKYDKEGAWLDSKESRPIPTLCRGIKISSYKNVSTSYFKNKDTRRVEPIEENIYCIKFELPNEKLI
jgi:hypothetical protein